VSWSSLSVRRNATFKVIRMILLHKITSAFCHRYALLRCLLWPFLTSMQLCRLVEASVSQGELAQILAQLHTLVQPTPTNATPTFHASPKHSPAMPYLPSFTYQQTVVPAGCSLVHPQSFPTVFRLSGDILEQANSPHFCRIRCTVMDSATSAATSICEGYPPLLEGASS